MAPTEPPQADMFGRFMERLRRFRKASTKGKHDERHRKARAEAEEGYFGLIAALSPGLLAAAISLASTKMKKKKAIEAGQWALFEAAIEGWNRLESCSLDSLSSERLFLSWFSRLLHKSVIEQFETVPPRPPLRGR